MTVSSSGFPLSSVRNEKSFCDTPTPKGVHRSFLDSFLPELYKAGSP